MLARCWIDAGGEGSSEFGDISTDGDPCGRNGCEKTTGEVALGGALTN